MVGVRVRMRIWSGLNGLATKSLIFVLIINANSSAREWYGWIFEVHTGGSQFWYLLLISNHLYLKFLLLKPSTKLTWNCCWWWGTAWHGVEECGCEYAGGHYITRPNRHRGNQMLDQDNTNEARVTVTVFSLSLLIWWSRLVWSARHDSVCLLVVDVQSLVGLCFEGFVFVLSNFSFRFYNLYSCSSCNRLCLNIILV